MDNFWLGRFSFIFSTRGKYCKNNKNRNLESSLYSIHTSGTLMGSVRYWNRKWDDCRNTALSSAFHCCGSTSIKCNEVRIARTAAATDDFPPLNILERVWLLVSMITFCTVAIDHKSNILLYSRNLLVLRDSKPRKVFYGWCFWPVHFYMPTSVIGFTDHKRGQFIFICVPDTFFLGALDNFLASIFVNFAMQFFKRMISNKQNNCIWC